MKFDMHCHTREGSIDARISITEYAAILKKKGFDGMLVTDHDSYQGYNYALSHQEEMPEDFVLIKGIEYDTRDAGHFLIILPDDVHLPQLERRGLKISQLIHLVHEFGGVIGMAHPYGMKSSSGMHFQRWRRDPRILRQLDFLEGLNTCERAASNHLARDLAELYKLPCTGGSDSHKAEYVGSAFTDFDRDIMAADDMISAIREGGIAAYGGKERQYLKRHGKRNWFVTTWTFKIFNYSVGTVLRPYHSKRLKEYLSEAKARNQVIHEHIHRQTHHLMEAHHHGKNRGM